MNAIGYKRMFKYLSLGGPLAMLPAVVAAATLLAVIPNERAPGANERVVPAAGVLLVAKPGMADPRFQETVVLLLAHGDEGTLGLILNRPTDLNLARLLPDLEAPEKERHVVFYGGPVGLNLLLYLVRSTSAPQAARPVMGNVYYGADREMLGKLLNRRQQGTDALRLYVGHAGWAAGQLAGEIARGDWLLVKGDSRTVFDGDLQKLWPELMKRQPPRGMTIEAPKALPAGLFASPS